MGGGAAGLRTAVLALLVLLAGWTGTATAAAAPSFGTVVTSSHAGLASAGRPSSVRPFTGRPGERAGVGQATVTPGATVTQPDQRIAGPVPALPTSTVVLVPQIGVGGRTPTGPPQVPGSFPSAAVRGRAPPLLVSPAPDQ